MEKGEVRNKLIRKVQDEVVHALKIIHYLSLKCQYRKLFHPRDLHTSQDSALGK